MERTVEPYYFDNLKTSIKSFKTPYIEKLNCFISSIKHDEKIVNKESDSKEFVFDSDNESAIDSDEDLEVQGLFDDHPIKLIRTNSLEPYFRPKIAINYNNYVDSIDDSDDEIDLTIKPHPEFPVKNVVRDDFDNDTSFDFFL